MHPVIALWSHPRSMSTATERVMRARGDLTCFHEPFMYDYYVHRAVRPMPHFEIDPALPQSYEAIRDSLLGAAEEGPVFFKDMSYYVMPRILDDPALAPRLTNSFLIRNPLRSILSYHKLDPELTSEEVGLEAQWRHYEALAACGAALVVIEAEAVQADTAGAMNAYWEKIGLPAAPHAFNWNGDTPPEEWQQVAGWHGDVASSSGIRPPDPEEDAKQEATFDAAAAEAPRLRELLAHHRPFYEKLKRATLA
ncbi:MAG: hypothetical protein AAF495_01305 [Pseudomonadota bacterium]